MEILTAAVALPEFGAYFDAAGSAVGLLTGHLPAVSAAGIAAGALWAFWKKENLDVCKNIWVVLEKDAKGVPHFRMYSEASARVSSLFPSDPILRWRLRRAARSAKPPTNDLEYAEIDYIPLGAHVSRLRRELAAFVSGAPLQWYRHVCKIVGSVEDPYAVLLTEQYPNGADMCFRNILIHPTTFGELAKMDEDMILKVVLQRDNHIDLLRRLIFIAQLHSPGCVVWQGKAAGRARAAMELMNIMLPKAA
jgi:hypothetical protein